MSVAIRKERITTATMEPLLNGGYQRREYQAFAWMCSGCGLVWDKKHLAEECEGRNHKPSFNQMYGCRGTVNGRPIGNIYYIERRAIRREKGR